MKYTAGELAKKLGVSARTVRWYDEKNLLAPCGYTEAGYRIYDDESVTRLQRIIMLRFMDFSLEQICEMMQETTPDIRTSLLEQECLLLEKKAHIEQVIEAVRKTRNSSDAKLWDNMLKIIDMTKDRENVILQYLKDDNLSKRISIHDYSIAKEPFYTWMQKKLSLTDHMKILDIGCGNAAFWEHIANTLPDGLEIHLVDYSEGMLESAKKTMDAIQKRCPEKNLKFVLDKRDAADFSYPVRGFDRIMANHMLYHLNRDCRLKLYPKINELLTENGMFSCSLIGKTHLAEMHEFIRKYYPQIGIPSDSFDIWLETARDELQDFFTVLAVDEQENDLLVPDAELVYTYISSFSKQAEEIICHDRTRFLERIRQMMDADGCMYIHKSTGVVLCKKRL